MQLRTNNKIRSVNLKDWFTENLLWGFYFFIKYIIL